MMVEEEIAEESRTYVRNIKVEDNECTESRNCGSLKMQDVNDGNELQHSDHKRQLEENKAEIHTVGGHKYSGSISSGVLQGLGYFEWCDGIIYDGYFWCGKVTGTGKYKWPNGSVYEGEVLNGLRHGRGCFICANQKTVYTGQWKLGKRNGEGKLVYNLDDQSCCYEGHWVDNMKDGYGRMQYSSGNVYDGEWKNDKHHGVGTMHWFERGEVYTGEWLNGFQHGVGTHLWTFISMDPSQYPLRNWYEGDWVRGQKHGHGIFHYSSGSSYEGSWANNKKYGQGNYTTNNGLKFQCSFVDDKIQSVSEDSISYKIVLGDIKLSETNEEFMTMTKELGYASQSDKISIMESSHLQALLLRSISELRQAYKFYSSLGTDGYSNKVSVMNGLQLASFLQDVNIQRYGVTIFDMECFLDDNSNSFAKIHDPSRYVLMKDFNRTILLLASKTYGLPFHLVESLVRKVLDSATTIHGWVFSGRKELTLKFLNFKTELWGIYVNTKRKESDPRMKYRDIWTLFQKSKLFAPQWLKDKNFSEVLTLITEDGLDGLNLEMNLSFLEFFEVVLRFVSVTVPLSKSSSVIQWHRHLEHTCQELQRAIHEEL